MSSSRRAQTRIQILEAARAIFEELGYYGAGLEAVAKKAGVSRQAIYLHFPSKAELLTALHLHIFDTDVVPDLLSLTRVHNTGAAFGMLNGVDFAFKAVVMSLVAVLALGGVGWYAMSVPRSDVLARAEARVYRSRR